MRFGELIWSSALEHMVEVSFSDWSNPAAHINLDVELEEMKDPMTLVSSFI